MARSTARSRRLTPRPKLVELMQQIVNELNAEGHDLQLYFPPAGAKSPTGTGAKARNLS